MVGDVQNARLHAVIVSAHEIVVRMIGHVGRGYGDVLVAGDVHARAVIVFVIGTRGDGEARHRALAVVHDGVHVRREDGLRVVVDRHGGVGPPQERLRQGRGVVELAPDLQVGAAGMERKAGHALGAVHAVHLADAHGLAAVGVFHDGVIHRHERGGTVVLRPVELDAAADPRPHQAHQRGLDDLVVVDEVVAVGLVIGALHASAQLRQDHHAQIVVFQPNRAVGLIHLFVVDLVNYGKGIHLAAAALIHALFQKHGIGVGLAHAVGGNDHAFLPDFNLTGNMFHSDSLLAGFSCTYHSTSAGALVDCTCCFVCIFCSGSQRRDR